MGFGRTMAAETIDGKAMAEALRARIATETAGLKRDRGVVPGLAVVLVGDNPASQVYVKSKSKQAQEAGIRAIDRKLPKTASQADVLGVVSELNADPAVHGILVQLPLPSQIDSSAVLRQIDPAKDVDGFHPMNVGYLASGQMGARLRPLHPAR